MVTSRNWINEINELERKYDMWSHDYNLAPQDIELLFRIAKELIMENNDYSNVLKFYANKKNYDARHGLAIFKDGGDKAETVLSDKGESNG